MQEKLLRAAAPPAEPPCGFYGRLLADIEAIGWQRVVSIGDRLTSVEVRIECVR